VWRELKMTSMKDFMQEQEIRGFLKDVQIKLNETRVFGDTIISDETFETAVEIYEHIYTVYNRLIKEDEENSGTYIASCLATYLMLFNELSKETVILDT
jgi:hypothetical protein